MAPESCRPEGFVGDPARVIRPRGNAGQDLRTDTLDSVVIEARFAQRKTQQAEGFIPVAGEGFQISGEIVERCVEGQADGLIGQPCLKSL